MTNQVQLGLKENWKQFALLVLINGFVGGMVGMERSIIPELASQEFGLSSKTAILSFIIWFGISKAVANYLSGKWSQRFSKKRLLLLGWSLALPVPFLLIYAPSWEWIILANVLLGVHQGFSWSITVMMKIDLVGEKDRGLAMGINESAGYLAVGLLAFLTGWIASEYGIRPYPFYLGIGMAVLGLLLTSIFVKDTLAHVQKEAAISTVPLLNNVFKETTWAHRNLGSISQAGLVNNLNDGMIWGLLPILLAGRDFTLVEIGKIVAIYPMVWGLSQLITGKMADRFRKKSLLFFGMVFQGIAIAALAYANSISAFVLLSVALGIGTAVVYPTFLAAVADNTHPSQRAESLGIFRFWRDSGYAFGALLSGILSELLSIEVAILVIAGITLLSGMIVKIRMTDQE
jgi:MFS family permease